MPASRPAPRALPEPARVVRQLVKIGGLLGMTQTESLVLAVFGIGALADWLAEWAEVDGLTMADTLSWLDQLATAALSPEHHPSQD